MAKASSARKLKADEVNKSEKIRQAMKQLGPSARPRDIISTLKEQGIDVSAALVTNVMTRTSGRKPKKRATQARAGGRDAVTIGELLEAKRFVEAIGSMEAARRALQAWARLID